MAIWIVDVVTKHFRIVEALLFELVHVPGICVELRPGSVVSDVIPNVELSQRLPRHVHVESLLDAMAALYDGQRCILAQDHTAEQLLLDPL